MQTHANTPPPRENDEIDLGQLMMNIWATRGRVALSLLAVTAIFCVYLAVSYFTSPKPTRYSYVFDLAFEGLQNGKFPNGSRFLLSDVISPTVLNRVYRSNELEGYDLPVDDFRRSVNIQPYAPDYLLIKERYERQLADKKLGASDIAELQRQMNADLKAASSGSFRITLQLPDGKTLPDTVASKVLMDIGSVWGKRAIDELGVLKPSLPVYSERIFDQERFENIDYLMSMDLLLNSIELVRGNISALKKEPNATNLVDEETGFTLADLDKAIQDVADYDIRQIVDPIRQLGISRNKQVVTLHYTRRLEDLRDEKRILLERAKAIRSVLRDYSREIQSDGSSAVASNQNNLVPQLGDAFLDRLLEVSRQGSDLEFRQKLMAEVLEFENKAIDKERAIADIEKTLLALEGGRGDAQELRDIYLKEVAEVLPKVLDTLRGYTQVVVRLYEKQGRQVAGNTSQLLDGVGGSFERKSPIFISDENIKVLMILLLLLGVVSVFMSLFLDMVRRRNS
ncbi:hypothetical protein HW090_15315 [Pseudomonas sp. ABC1]|uniref:hypothetical protein n=1 Tax=Pseudomonas sp. ABC1 TaxID=2748080 RepID=UPI0015C3D40C|nr:hypothetical protein [Pseudomonas sp. ABC1]QLF94488.1 hypothetical protein HW090_15315 [Pseudomonas sp. ABC1]